MMEYYFSFVLNAGKNAKRLSSWNIGLNFDEIVGPLI